MGFDGLTNLLAQSVPLQQMAKGEDRGLIGNPNADQLDAGKEPHRGNLNQGLLHGRVAQRIPLLQKVDLQKLLCRSLGLRG